MGRVGLVVRWQRQNQKFRLGTLSLRGLFVTNAVSSIPFPPWPTPGFIHNFGGQCLSVQSPSSQHLGAFSSKRGFPRLYEANPEGHPMFPMCQWNSLRHAYMVPPRVPRKTKCICSLTFSPFLFSELLTFHNYPPASTPDEMHTPGLCRVCLGEIQPKSIKYANVNIQEANGYTILEIRENVGIEV